jgi:predicted phosphodiesterase
MTKDQVQKIYKRKVEPFVIDETCKPVPIPPPMEVRGDAVVVSDVHVNDTDEALVTRSAEVNLDILIIASDLFNMAAFSTFPKTDYPESYDAEMDLAEKLMKYYLRYFKDIYWITGNHDERLTKMTRAEHGLKDVVRSVVDSADRPRVHFSPLNYMYLFSGDRKWLIAHQNKYAKTRLLKAQALCDIHHCNVLTAHEHHAGITLSRDGLYTLVNNPMLANDPAYVKEHISDMPRMCKGFSVIREGRVDQYVEGALFGLQ